MISVVLINQYFWPDMAATAQLLADLAEDLAAAGHRVTVLTGRGSYAPGRKGRLLRREAWRGVEIRRIWCTDLGRRSMMTRVVDYATFLVSLKLALVFGRRHDVAVFLSTPPLVALLGVVARLRGARFVYKVEDLYPDIAVALGTFRSGWPAARSLAALSRHLLARADVAVALDGAMADTLGRRGARRVEVIPNWADGRAIVPDVHAGAAFRREHGLEAAFVVLYSGNLGLAHRFDAVIAAARALAVSRPQVVFLFVGAGPRLAEVCAMARDLGSVRFLPYQPQVSLRGLFNAADVHLVTLRDEVMGFLVPCKFSAALAAGKPVLLVGGCATDLRRQIEDEGLGWWCPHDASAVTAAVDEALGVPGLAAARGAAGRRVFEERYDRARCTAKWSDLLVSVAAGGRASG